MERKTFTNELVDTISLTDGQDIQELITELIDIKREKRKEGWSNLTVGKTLIDKEYPGFIVIRGDLKETDEQMERRRKDMEAYEGMPTGTLLAKLDATRKHRCDSVAATIKDVLATREHISTSKAERKAIRSIQSRTGIKSVQEVIEKHSDEIAHAVRNES